MSLTRLGRRDLKADDGSTIPLVLGFFLIGLLVVAGAVLASDAYTKQRDLQSICDGAVLAAANAVDSRTARTQPLSQALPLAGVQQATETYLARDPNRAGVSVRAAVARRRPDRHGRLPAAHPAGLRLGHRPRRGHRAARHRARPLRSGLIRHRSSDCPVSPTGCFRAPSLLASMLTKADVSDRNRHSRESVDAPGTN